MTLKRERLKDLQAGAIFTPRHIELRESDIASMLKVVGESSLEGLIIELIPAYISMNGILDLPEALSGRNRRLT